MCRIGGDSEGSTQINTEAQSNLASGQEDASYEEAPDSDEHDSANESSGSDDCDAESARHDDLLSEENDSVSNRGSSAPEQDGVLTYLQILRREADDFHF